MALACLLAAPPAAPDGERACVPLAPGETLKVDLADAPLLDVAHVVSCALEVNLLFQPPSLGDKRVTVFGPRPLDRRAVAGDGHVT